MIAELSGHLFRWFSFNLLKKGRFTHMKNNLLMIKAFIVLFSRAIAQGTLKIVHDDIVAKVLETESKNSLCLTLRKFVKICW